MLAARIRAETLAPGAAVLDLCTGSGVLAIAAARAHPTARVAAPLAELPRRGLARAWEGGPDGRRLLDRICADADAHLRPGGVVLLVHNARIGEDATIRRLRAAGLEAAVVFRHRGRLGPILTARAQWLRQSGLLGEGDRDDVVIVRGVLPRPAALATLWVAQPISTGEPMSTKPIKQPGPDHPITLEDTPGRVVVTVAGRVVADSTHAVTLREADYPPVQYIPFDDVEQSLLEPTDNATYYPYKGDASYYSIPAGGERSANAVWQYREPHAAVARIKDHVAFYPNRVDAIEELEAAA